MKYFLTEPPILKYQTPPPPSPPPPPLYEEKVPTNRKKQSHYSEEAKGAERDNLEMYIFYAQFDGSQCLLFTPSLLDLLKSCQNLCFTDQNRKTQTCLYLKEKGRYGQFF